jgi:hypothetical protein
MLSIRRFLCFHAIDFFQKFLIVFLAIIIDKDKTIKVLDDFKWPKAILLLYQFVPWKVIRLTRLIRLPVIFLKGWLTSRENLWRYICLILKICRCLQIKILSISDTYGWLRYSYNSSICDIILVTIVVTASMSAYLSLLSNHRVIRLFT